MVDDSKKLVTKPPAPGRSGAGEIENFVQRARTALMSARGETGRLVLAIDATMSRQPTWDMACGLQARMFDAVGKTGRLDVQLIYFRGASECRASAFVHEADRLKHLMTKIDCRAGNTQIGKVLAHVLHETAEKKVDCVVYIGDAMEERLEELSEKAGALGLHGVPVFVFQEGRDAIAEQAFREIARLTKGAWFRFDRSAAETLARLLSAIAIFASGGIKALETRGRPEDKVLIGHLRSGSTP